MEFSHLDDLGRAKMVDVSTKKIVRRTARAIGEIFLDLLTITAIRDEKLPKGDVLTVAKMAGIAAAKQTSQVMLQKTKELIQESIL